MFLSDAVADFSVSKYINPRHRIVLAYIRPWCKVVTRHLNNTKNQNFVVLFFVLSSVCCNFALIFEDYNIKHDEDIL